jgi:hypothetical protein
VNQVEPNERGDDWLFEVAFDPEGTALHKTDELELVEASGQQHEAEIELALRAPSADATRLIDHVRRLAEETFAVEHCGGHRTTDTVFVQIAPLDHPRDVTRGLMARLGSSWLVEDDGWYANVHSIGETFPIPGVDHASLFLRPWRDPRPGPPLPGEPHG